MIPRCVRVRSSSSCRPGRREWDPSPPRVRRTRRGRHLSLTLADLARAVAEPALLGRGLLAWDGGHAALVAARLLEGPHRLALAPDVPRAPVAAALARTLSSSAAPTSTWPPRAHRAPGCDAEDRERLRALADLYRGFHERIEGRSPTTQRCSEPPRAPRGGAMAGRRGGPDRRRPRAGAVERGLVIALASRFPVRLLERDALPPPVGGLRGLGRHPRHPRSRLGGHGARGRSLRPRRPLPSSASRRACSSRPPAGRARRLRRAPDRARRGRRSARHRARPAPRSRRARSLRGDGRHPAAAAGVRAPLSPTAGRVGIPYRLHPSLPLRLGRTARSLLLLFRCRGLPRAEVMELLTFAPIPSRRCSART